MSSVREHHPGPWEWDGKFTVGVPLPGGTAYFRCHPEDARIIVASPEMYTALEMISMGVFDDPAEFARGVLTGIKERKGEE